ncbi:hypothetical protein ABU614_01560 [Lysobacter firmicutimachus]|uniref:DUF3828 domain-containing protein n=1 Tax=Lysobacter firmicutimachus TaxID=1792846 RepID=A0AAU8MWK2_9GAMM|nr:hypothetical protein [Lysobacter antibioticus]
MQRYRVAGWCFAILFASMATACGSAGERPQHAPSARAADAVRGDSAQAVAEAFYRVHVDIRSGGLPDGEAMQRYRPLLSKRLLGLIAGAARERDAAIAAHPDEKPPFVDGDLFSSLYEGPTGYRIGARTVSGPDRESFEIELSYREPPSSEVSRWTDRALLLREDGQWKLDDIEYGGQWDFASRGRLSEALRGGR